MGFIKMKDIFLNHPKKNYIWCLREDSILQDRYSPSFTQLSWKEVPDFFGVYKFH